MSQVKVVSVQSTFSAAYLILIFEKPHVSNVFFKVIPEPSRIFLGFFLSLLLLHQIWLLILCNLHHSLGSLYFTLQGPK